MQGKPEMPPLSPETADRLLAAHDGDMALLYLYALRRGGIDPEDAARVLCRTLAEVNAAAEKLSRLMDMPEAAPKRPADQPLLPPEDPPEYTAKDIADRTRDDPAFTGVLREAERVLGHKLSSPDLKALFGVYDYLRLPADVMMLLLNHCVRISVGRTPSMRFIEKEAYAWANRGILTYEAAEEHIERSTRLREQSAKAAELLGIRGRELTATESRYITSWLELGFGEELLGLAYDRTVTNTGGLKWSYMNSILKSWAEKGLFTLQDVQEKDGRRRKPGKAAVQAVNPEDLHSLIEGLNKI